MKKLLIFICIYCISIASCADNSIALHDSDGRTIKMSYFKDKWLILNYWADWCETCIEEIPELNKFYEHNIDKNVLIYGVNYDQPTPYELKQSVHKMGIAFPVLVEDPGFLWKLGEIPVIPMTFIINPEGKVVKRIVGINTEDSLRSIVNDYVMTPLHT
jgi:thiol-disulfide isomerase/thioredoxin